MTKSYPKILSGSTLKIIAVIAMIIDHIGLGIWYRLPDLGYLVPETMDLETWWSIYRIMRNIGRISFPIFAFLLVEGFIHTRSYLKYALRLFVFALISQLPFHYAFLGLAEGLNIFFTLLIGLMAMWGMDALKKKCLSFKENIKRLSLLCYLTGWALIVFAAGYLAKTLDTDYDYKGVLLIVVLYIFHKNRIIALITSYLSFKFAMYRSTVTAVGFLEYIGADFYFPGFILACFYNGSRGLKVKYLFYFVYPAHLALIYVVWNYIM